MATLVDFPGRHLYERQGVGAIQTGPLHGTAARATVAAPLLESVFQFMCVRRQRSCGHGQIFFVDDVATFQFTSCHVDARVHPFHRGKEQCHFVCQQCTNCDGQRNECGDNRVSGRGFGVLVCVLCRVLFFPFSFTVCKCHSGLPRLPLTFWPLTCFFCCCCFAFLVLNQTINLCRFATIQAQLRRHVFCQIPT